jgi:hypothetical protein
MGYLPRLPQQRLHHSTDREAPIFAKSDECGMRQLAFGRIGDDAKGSEG